MKLLKLQFVEVYGDGGAFFGVPFIWTSLHNFRGTTKTSNIRNIV